MAESTIGGTKRQANTPTGSSPPRKFVRINKGGKGHAPAVTAASAGTRKQAAAGAKSTGSSSKTMAPSGPPVLRASTAASKVPIPDRNLMLQKLYEGFLQLYAPISARNPALASEHALAQELEIYNKTHAKTYRNATTNTLIAIRKRPPPTSLHHTSVGTESEVHARAAAAKEYPSLKLTPADLDAAILSSDQLTTWGFMTEVPEAWGQGGGAPNHVGKKAQCERCDNEFVVRADPVANECQFHWGRPWARKVEGKRKKFYTCCQEECPHEGCTRGVHVFYETDAEALHYRYPFSVLSPPETEDMQTEQKRIVAIDCEMIYTTAGMSVARVSVVDEMGSKVFDELVKPSPGVDVLDFNSRFSGVHSLNEATMDLSDIREALTSVIGPDTIIIGHAVDNDLKTLRIVHHKIVDTIALFPHPEGPPRRRALRDVASEVLGRTIQAGASSSGETGMGTVGHSSLEDARATLDLVRWWVCEKRKRDAATSSK
ncbi:RNA exonuclease 3 [Tulasnella sp. 403]|nr:RNA exonuclease 3 [Tulasnella sp. 403]